MHYFQLQDTLNSSSLKTELQKEPTEFESLMIHGDGSTKRKLSVTYKVLLSLDKNFMAGTKRKWEHDCNISYMEGEWAALSTAPMMLTTWIPL